MKIISVVGARPNFVKIAPFIKAIILYNSNLKSKKEFELIDHVLVHTGQHYDERMNDSFFKNLGISRPDINLGVGSGTHAEQVGNTMIEFEKVLKLEKPDWVVLVGDVNATLACSITAKKENIKCCHIEAGLRSGDMTMPEEINRLVTDRLSDLLLAPDVLSVDNLYKEGNDKNQVRFVGNIMIDSLDDNITKAGKIKIQDIFNENNLIPDQEFDLSIFDLDDFGLLTMHRPSNVDNKEKLCSLVPFITNELAIKMKIIWPLHPRTMKQLKFFGLWDQVIRSKNILVLNPINYLEMLRLNLGAKIVLTDSGGIQEECCITGTPCITLRKNTERPITLVANGGVSVLVGNDIEKIRKEFDLAMEKRKSPFRPELWDGKTAARCLKEIVNYNK